MMKNEATLRFKNFAASPCSFWIHPKLALAGAALCCACLTEVICPERSNADAKPSRVGKNLKNQNFKNQNATGAYYDADRDINFNAYRDINSSADRGMCHGINSNADRAENFKISNANLKADLARPKADFR